MKLRNILASKVFIFMVFSMFFMGMVFASTTSELDVTLNQYNNDENFDLSFYFNNSENLEIKGYMISYDFNESEVEPIAQEQPENNGIFENFTQVVPFGGVYEGVPFLSQALISEGYNGSGKLGKMSFKRVSNGSITLEPVEFNLGVFLKNGTYLSFEEQVVIPQKTVAQDSESCSPNWVIQEFSSCINFEKTAYYSDVNSCGQSAPSPIVESCNVVKNLVPQVVEIKLAPSKNLTISAEKIGEDAWESIEVNQITEETDKLVFIVRSHGEQRISIVTTFIGIPKKVLIDGQEVSFSVVGEEIVFTTSFSERIITLDYTEPIVQQSENTGGGSSSGSSSSGSSSNNNDDDDEGSSSSQCLTEWTCTSWGDCTEEGIQKRSCSYSSNECVPLSSKPAIERKCDSLDSNDTTINLESDSQDSKSFSTGWTIALWILVISLVIVILWIANHYADKARNGIDDEEIKEDSKDKN